MDFDLLQSGAKEYFQGKYVEAVAEWDKLITSDPNNVTLLCNRAAAYFEMEMYRKCETECDKIIKKDPNYLQAYILKGISLKHRNKEKEAKKVLDASLTQKNSDILLMRYIYNLYSDKEETIALQNLTTTQRPSGIVVKEASALVIKDPSTSLAKTQLTEAMTDGEANEKVLLGYYHVNTGQLTSALALFDSVIAERKNVPIVAYLGRGTAQALLGNLTNAISDFSKAIEIDPTNDDAWKRRGQARAAKGNFTDALSDLSRAIQLKPTSDVYHQRATIYYKQKNYIRALSDYEKANEYDPKCPQSLNQRGFCTTAIGRPWDAISLHQKALEYDPSLKQAWVYLGQAYKEWGNYEDAYHNYSKALELDPAYTQCYHLRGVSSFSAGYHRTAIADFDKACSIEPEHIDSRHMAGVAKHGLGLITAAIADYDVVINQKPDHVCWYNKQISLYVSHHLDVPINEFNFDRDLSPHFKESWCKRLNPYLLPNYKAQPPLRGTPEDDINLNIQFTPNELAIIDAANKFGPKIQLNCVGYMANKRQWRMCGLAVIDVAQHLKKCWQGGYTVGGKASTGCTKEHEFGWRDMYDIIVRWRQYSEPNDPVVWVDLLTQEQFEEGFGSHTPMITGQTHVVRYSPMATKSFPILKSLISQVGLTNEQIGAVKSAKNCMEVYEIVRKDFWVCTPCHSVANPGKIYEGTRLTIQYVHPEGYEFSIRTAGIPSRWKEYTQEMDFIFGKLKAAITKPKEERDLDEISDWILTLTFFWYNFMPLARGTAACGYIGLLGLFLSIDIEITANVPALQQVDWEGILNPQHDIFINALKPWMYPARTPTKILDELPPVTETFGTLRKMIEALNYGLDKK